MGNCNGGFMQGGIIHAKIQYIFHNLIFLFDIKYDMINRGRYTGKR